ncbi:hypothetical protein C8R43DRAFT_1240407 [Mycena crocata]|nr:hypothetical protein C8R43DRAFT_1240407 [Mycena crocata]
MTLPRTSPMLRVSERRHRGPRSQSANRNRQCCCTVAVYNSTLKPSVPAFKPCLCVEDLMAFPPSYYLVAYLVAFNSSFIHVAFGSNLKNGFNSWACMDSIPSRRCYLTRNEGTIAVLLRVEVALLCFQNYATTRSALPFVSRLNILEGCVQLKSEGFLHVAFSSKFDGWLQSGVAVNAADRRVIKGGNYRCLIRVDVTMPSRVRSIVARI